MTRWPRPGIFLAAAALFAADRFTKYLAVEHLSPGQSEKIVPGIFHLTLVFNNGAAFGLLRNRAAFFIVFSIAVIVVILMAILRDRTPDLLRSVSMALILGGAAGNLVDRIRYGYVIDFMDFRVWPVFNVADAAITIGVAIIAYVFIFKRTG